MTTPNPLLSLFADDSRIPSTLRPHASRLTALLHCFRTYYAVAYGESRIDALIAALCEPTRHCAMINTYSPTISPPESYLLPVLSTSALEPLSFTSTKAYTSSSPSFLPPSGNTHYLLDAASLLPVEALAVTPGHKVLDLCAAPGGKSLAILQHLSGAGSLTSNELDPARRRRLRGVLAKYILPSLTTSERGELGSLKLEVTGQDATVSISGGEYDRILIDAPCSSERHVLHSALKAVQSGTSEGLADLLAWNPQKLRRMAKVQKELLRQGLRRLNVDGRLVYATCSISSEENDEVVKSVVAGQRWNGRIKVVRAKGEERWPGERTKYGWLVLPDRGGWGPLYFAILKRIE
jgi:16S rRNA C967 or C1407 C5-methylase (RsmB/RsmF family)